MREIAGAAEQLARDGILARDQLLWLADELTPHQQRGELRGDEEPRIVVWGEELLYGKHFQLTLRLPAPDDPTVAERAATLLESHGWQVETTHRTVVDTGVTTLTGRRDGFRLAVWITDGRGVHCYGADTPPTALYEHEPFVPPEPVVTVETVGHGYELCYECDGLGWCATCLGRGWTLGGRTWGGYTSGRVNCVMCHRDRVCVICRGAGRLPQSG